MGVDRRWILASAGALVAGCTATPKNRIADANAFAEITGLGAGSMPYILFPGDEIDITLPSAQELNRQLTIAPDGRVSLPMIGHVMAAERGIAELESQVSQAYAEQLVRPAVEISLRKAGPIKIWVDGQVREPGVYDLPAGDIDAYRALLLAGGTLAGSKAAEAALIRRNADGMPVLVKVDLRPGSGPSPIIRRGDIIFVPRNGLGELAAFFSLVREAMPIGFSYALNGGWN